MSLAIRLNDNNELDLALDEQGGLAVGDDLTTAMMLSLLCDRQASTDDALPSQTDPFPDRRGWWGDHYSPDPSGSKYWLRSRSKPDDQLLHILIADSKEATDHLIKSGVCRDIDITAEYIKPDPKHPNLVAVGIHLRLLKQNGNEAKFDYVWNNK